MWKDAREETVKGNQKEGERRQQREKKYSEEARAKEERQQSGSD